jgi:predicted AAA+ superfamily ATPase
VTNAIQVCYTLDDYNKEREINGLIEAMENFKLKAGLILTYNQTDNFVIDEKKISLIPVWKWLIS